MGPNIQFRNMARPGAACVLALALMFAQGGQALAQKSEQGPIVLATMGSLFFGGSVIHRADGETFHGDHGYAQFYVPEKARDYPLILWHGVGQSGKCFESTPDGREGYQAILPRHGWGTYIIDQPRRGRAGYTSERIEQSVDPTTTRESFTWNAFRNGLWVPPGKASLYPGVRFPSDPASIEQFFRQQTPDTGSEPRDNEHRAFMGKAMASLLERTGPAILVTHSNSGQYGWFAGMFASDSIRAIVAFEPGQLVFPDDEPIPDVPVKDKFIAKLMQGIQVPAKEFEQLTRMPILLIYGDNISETISGYPPCGGMAHLQGQSSRLCGCHQPPRRGRNPACPSGYGD